MKFRSVPNLILKKKFEKSRVGKLKFSLCLTDNSVRPLGTTRYCRNHTEHMNKYTVWPRHKVLNFKLGGTYSNHWTLKSRVSHLHKSCISRPVPNNTGAGHAESRGRATVNKWIGKGVDAKRRDVFTSTIPWGLITYHGISSERDAIRSKN